MSRQGSLKIGSQALMCLGGSQHQMEPKVRSGSRKENGALKGMFCHSAMCAPGVSPISPALRAQDHRLRRDQWQDPSLGKQKPQGSSWKNSRTQILPRFQRCGPAGACGLHGANSTWFGRWDSRSNCGHIFCFT